MERQSVLLLAAVVVVVALAGSVGAACPCGFQPLPYGACVKLFSVEVQFGPTWEEANENCKKEDAQLISLDTPEKLEQFSVHLFSLDLGGNSYCVGARKTESGWCWLNGEKLSSESHMWLPYQPEGNHTHARIVPMTRHPRYYLTPYDDCRDYACEADDD
ncbi:uncharacterized protein LOC135090354 [Scylla paramamosain]|uniref:uncharacterized protein LOC135090354 n=1 Tax=Scylla paramamosain TaxID=85552 RepID=UPI0030830BCA